MLARQLLGVVAALALGHLTVVGGDLSCATHAYRGGSPVATTGAVTDEGMPEHAMHAGAPATTDDTAPPCDAPSGADCCHALGSCSVTMALAAPTARGNVSLAQLAATTDAGRPPASIIQVPDPPPPKA